jgi:hypothetical protein
VVDLKYRVFSLLHWSLLTEFSLSVRENDALHFQVFLMQVCKRNEVGLYQLHTIFIEEDVWLLMNQIKRSNLGPNSVSSLPFEYGYSLCCQVQEVAETCHAKLVAGRSLFLVSIQAQRILFEGLRNDSWHRRWENSFFYVTNRKLLRSVLQENNSKTQYSWHLNETAKDVGPLDGLHIFFLMFSLQLCIFHYTRYLFIAYKNVRA